MSTQREGNSGSPSKSLIRYVAVSTKIAGEVVEYPDSGNVAVYVGSAPGGDPASRTFNFRGRLGPRVEYWDGE